MGSREWRRLAVGGLGAACAIAAFGWSASASAPRIHSYSCRYVEAGAPGRLDNYLVIKAFDPTRQIAHVRRVGRRLRVFLRRPRNFIPCRGGTPTVRNIENIHLFERSHGGLVLDLRGARLGPGVSEPGPAAEIEVFVSGRSHVRGEPSVEVGLIEGPGNDLVRLGRASEGVEGINLNAAIEQTPDPDVFVEMPSDQQARIRVSGGAGNDRVDGLRADREVRRAVPPLILSVDGGAGIDHIVAGLHRAQLFGGSGNDFVRGTPENDHILPGAGADRVLAGPGPDTVAARDGRRDRIDCGGEYDRVTVDANDMATHCEQRFRAARAG
jgi:hypothetical protein